MKLRMFSIILVILILGAASGLLLGELLVNDNENGSEQAQIPTKEQSKVSEDILEEPISTYEDVLPSNIPEIDHDLEIAILPDEVILPEPVEEPEQKAWEINALPFDMHKIDGRPAIAIVIDDVGVAQSWTRKAIQMPAPMTMSFIPYGRNLDEHVANARAIGHEIMLHLPMEPKNPDVNPGDNALMTSLDGIELVDRMLWNLEQFEGYMGVNNHMGSKFTANAEGMGIVLNEMKLRGLSFIDSVTSGDTVGYKIAQAIGVPTTTRDIFLDHVRTEEAIWKQLTKVETLAQEKGTVLAIGHPHKETIKVLSEWAQDLEARGFIMVPASVILKIRNGYPSKDVVAVQD
ncbi:divergent polysaccharide deacetylase family protein [Curvivirga sp.]|uniref:divergent polysaccharide deacetylase family protein n=1 Tax=Curvivirga sp. TaxID=2856848 RepID=UPI003B5B047E